VLQSTENYYTGGRSNFGTDIDLKFKICFDLITPVKFVVTEDGKVGIGTSQPEAKLDVIGEIKSNALIINEQESAPITSVDEGCIYVKQAQSQSELYYRSELNGDEVQVTNNGKINISEPSNLSLGTSYSENVEYENNSEFKLLIIAYGHPSFSSDWFWLDAKGYIGEVTANILVTRYYFVHGSGGIGSNNTPFGTLTLIVPSGWKWKIDNDPVEGRIGVIDRIEVWEIN